jgi:hypothetical protein
MSPSFMVLLMFALTVSSSSCHTGRTMFGHASSSARTEAPTRWEPCPGNTSAVFRLRAARLGRPLAEVEAERRRVDGAVPPCLRILCAARRVEQATGAAEAGWWAGVGPAAAGICARRTDGARRRGRPQMSPSAASSFCVCEFVSCGVRRVPAAALFCSAALPPASHCEPGGGAKGFFGTARTERSRPQGKRRRGETEVDASDVAADGGGADSVRPCAVACFICRRRHSPSPSLPAEQLQQRGKTTDNNEQQRSACSGCTRCSQQQHWS